MRKCTCSNTYNTFHISQKIYYKSILPWLHWAWKKRVLEKKKKSTDLLKWDKITKIQLSLVFIYYIYWPGSFGLHWFIEQLLLKLLSSYTQHRPCPPNMLLVKVKEPWRSASQLVLGPQATRTARVVFWLESRLHFLPSFSPRSFCQRLTGVIWRWSVSLTSWTKWVYTAHTWDLMNTFFNQTFIYSSCIC